MERNVDYNTERKKLVLPEYGRSIQQMVEHAMTIDDKEERQRCANTIVRLMESIHGREGDLEELRLKLWNHLAAMSNYELDVDYPVEIKRRDDSAVMRERIAYPQKKITRRRYGAVVEECARKMMEIEDEEERNALAKLVANQMKRNLAAWNRDVMDDEKVAEDLAEYTEGKVSLTPEDIGFISNQQAISGVAQQNKKKRKK